MISTQLHPIHIELLITTFTISQTGRRCATQLGEGEGSSQCPGEETEKVWSGWFSLELLARCVTPFVFRHWQITVRIQIWVEDEGLMMELTTRRNWKLEKKCQEALILAVKYRRFAHRLKLMNNVLLCKVCFAHTEPGSSALAEDIKRQLEQLDDTICNNFFSPDTNQILLHYDNLKSELQSLYENKGKQAMFRAKCRWVEQGERPTKYFFNMEKRNYNKKTIRGKKKKIQSLDATGD